MIFGNIEQTEALLLLDTAIKRCMDYAKENDLLSFAKGTHTIEGEDLFVNIVEYETTSADKRFWEAHRQYLDVHLMLEGSEQIDLNSIQNMEQKEYVEADDFLPMEGEKSTSVILKKGDFLICYPDDGHRTAVVVNGPEKIKKAIFKVRI